jgi:hypothetical protein
MCSANSQQHATDFSHITCHDCPLPAAAGAVSCYLCAAWEGTLDDDEIVAVSNYVYDQAVNDKW